MSVKIPSHQVFNKSNFKTKRSKLQKLEIAAKGLYKFIPKTLPFRYRKKDGFSISEKQKVFWKGPTEGTGKRYLRRFGKGIGKYLALAPAAYIKTAKLVGNLKYLRGKNRQKESRYGIVSFTNFKKEADELQSKNEVYDTRINTMLGTNVNGEQVKIEDFTSDGKINKKRLRLHLMGIYKKPDGSNYNYYELNDMIKILNDNIYKQNLVQASMKDLEYKIEFGKKTQALTNNRLTLADKIALIQEHKNLNPSKNTKNAITTNNITRYLTKKNPTAQNTAILPSVLPPSYSSSMKAHTTPTHSNYLNVSAVPTTYGPPKQDLAQHIYDIASPGSGPGKILEGEAIYGNLGAPPPKPVLLLEEPQFDVSTEKTQKFASKLPSFTL